MRRFAPFVLAFAACARPAAVEDGRPRVLATTTMIADAARAVGEPCVRVVGLLPIGGDPHIYEPTPRDLREAAEADLVLANGLGLEGWLEKLVRHAGGRRPIVAVADGLPPLYARGREGFDPDPHMWGDPRLFLRYVDRIEAALARLAPSCTADIHRRAEAYRRRLRALDQWIRAAIATVPPSARILVTSHDAFAYYARAYGLTVRSPIGVSTDEEASARTMVGLTRLLREVRVPAVFVETTVNPSLVRQLAREARAQVAGPLYSDSLGPPGSGADTYLGMMIHNTRTIVAALGGQVPPLPPELAEVVR